MNLKVFLAACLTLIPVGAETLHYNITFQSGLNLGEAMLGADLTDNGSSFRASVDATVPGFILRDEYKSTSDAKFCSKTLERTIQRGQRKSAEKSAFDSENKKVVRQTVNGGKSEMATEACAHDAMAFVQILRQGLKDGRLPAAQAVYLGAKYDLTLTLMGSESVRVGDRSVSAERVRVAIHGPKSDHTIEIYFAKDATRTPVLARIPLALGTFSLELVP